MDKYFVKYRDNETKLEYTEHFGTFEEATRFFKEHSDKNEMCALYNMV